MVMRKTIKKARAMQTEINGTFRSMKKFQFEFPQIRNDEWNCIFRNVRAQAFHSNKLKFRCEFPEISMGEWYRVFQCAKRQAGIFQ